MLSRLFMCMLNSQSHTPSHTLGLYGWNLSSQTFVLLYYNKTIDNIPGITALEGEGVLSSCLHLSVSVFPDDEGIVL